MEVREPVLFNLIHSFLCDYLPDKRKSSSNTIVSYKTALNLFLNFISKSHNIQLSEITFNHINSGMINMFVNEMEQSGNCDSTCNHRIVSIRSFFQYVSIMEPSLTYILNEFKKVPFKKTAKKTIEYMSERAVDILLSIPDITTEKGIRDQFLMIMLYDTGARIQELLSLKIKDICFEKNATVRVIGKGNKKRSIPLMNQTVNHMKRYMNIFHPDLKKDDYVFYVVQKNQKQKMSDDNVRKLLNRYGKQARCVSLEVPEKIYPHLWRHSRAMHLYQHGMDLTLVSQWLGHSQLETTLIYAHADTEQKRKAIQKATPKDSPLAISGGTERLCVDDEILIKKLYGLI